MPKLMSLYLDDSGTRNPDRKVPEKFMYRDWFTLGGFITKEDDEGIIETAHDTFCKEWGITYPLYSYDIRSDRKFHVAVRSGGARIQQVHARARRDAFECSGRWLCMRG